MGGMCVAIVVTALGEGPDEARERDFAKFARDKHKSTLEFKPQYLYETCEKWTNEREIVFEKKRFSCIFEKSAKSAFRPKRKEIQELIK